MPPFPFLGLSLAHPGWTETVSEEREIKDERYSPYLGQDFPQQLWWGDTHVHTSFSTDAGMVGNRLGPDKAYEFALGRGVVSSTAVKIRLQRPLDFLVVADHPENLGLAPIIAERNAELLATPFCFRKNAKAARLQEPAGGRVIPTQESDSTIRRQLSHES